MTSFVDHLIVLFLFVVAPLWTARDYRALVRKVRAGDATARLSAYRWTVVLAWGFALVLVAWWYLGGRSLAALGLVVPPGARTVVGLVLSVLALAFLGQQWRATTSLAGEGLESLRRQVEPVADLMPHTPAEYRWFQAVSFTAGVCEEITYRGFLIWYLSQWMSPWIAAVLGAVGFGLGHLYQGRDGVVKTGVTGLLMGALFVGTGSLLWPMILHTAVDLQGGAIGRRLLVGEARGA